MARHLLRLSIILLVIIRVAGLGSCGQAAASRLNPAQPVTITCWHYYNGEQQANFDGLVAAFNETAGATKGVRVNAVSQGNVRELSAAIMLAAESGASEELPDVFATYPGTAFSLAEHSLLIDLSKCLSEEDLAAFQPDFLAEGHFTTSTGDGLYVLPIAKSSEAIALNLTEWRRFAAANARFADPAASLATWESLGAAAEAYRAWSGGRALAGFDSPANFLLVGSRQLGVDLTRAADGTAGLNLDHETLRQLWNVYYTNTVLGNFAAVGDYRTDDLANGSLIAGLVSTASGSWLPETVSSAAGRETVELSILPYPTFRGSDPVCVQQGAGMAVLRSDAQHEAAAAVFLDWLVRPEQNVNFTIASGYLPVTRKALESQLLFDGLRELADSENASDRGTSLCLNAFLAQMQTSNLYYPAAFPDSDGMRDYLESSLVTAAAEARQNWLADEQAHAGLPELQARYLGDAAFEAWYSDLILVTSQNPPLD